MIFVDTGFFFALFAKEEGARHAQARALMDTLRNRRAPEVLITTDAVIAETITLVQGSVKRNAHSRAVMIGDSRTDIATARAAGIPCICVPFGYTDVPIETLEPDLVIQHFAALPEAVSRILGKG